MLIFNSSGLLVPDNKIPSSIEELEAEFVKNIPTLKRREIFEAYKTPIDMITTSEVAVSVTIDNDVYLANIVKELEPFGTVEVQKEQSIVSIVGNHIAHTDSVLKKLFNAIDEVPVTMVSYGGSAHNISLLVPTVDRTKTLQLINSGLFGL